MAGREEEPNFFESWPLFANVRPLAMVFCCLSFCAFWPPRRKPAPGEGPCRHVGWGTRPRIFSRLFSPSSGLERSWKQERDVFVTAFATGAALSP